jgi:phage protein D
MEKLISVDVDDSLELPDMFVIHMSDPGIEMLNADVFKLGDSIEILAKVEAGPTPGAAAPQQKSLMKGEITNIEVDFNSSQRTTFVVRGYDRSHRMVRARKSRAYLQKTDSDIATELAQKSGLQANVTATSVVYPYLFQHNQTDWEFLMERAQRIGYRLYVEDKTLYFKPPPTSPPSTELKWGLTLERFQARLTTSDQVSEVTVYGWDPKAKKEIIGRASSPTNTAQNRKSNGSQTGAQAVQQAFSVKGKHEMVNQAVYTASEADKIAQATLDRMAANFMQAECHAGGNPDIVAGSGVDLKDVGARFSGKYLVTRSLHRYNTSGYTTHFWCSGNGNMTLTDLLTGKVNTSTNGAGKGGGGGGKPSAVGLTVGIVTNNNDPEQQGRVKVKFPSLGKSEGQDIESYWCRMVTIMAGPGQGVAYFPEANDEVVVAFVNGDPTQGCVLGCVWNGKDKLPKPPSKLVTGSQTIRRVQKSRLGHEIVLDDSPDPTQGIEIIDKTTKNFIKIITQKNKIHIECDQDIEVKSNTGNISVTAGTGNVEVKASAGKMDLTSMQDMTLSATGKVKITGTAGVEISATGKTSVTGTAGLDLTSPAITSVKGSMLNLN